MVFLLCWIRKRTGFLNRLHFFYHKKKVQGIIALHLFVLCVKWVFIMNT